MNYLRNIFAWALSVLAPVRAPAPTPVTKFNEHQGAKRVYARTLSGVSGWSTAMLRNLANIVNAPLRASGFALNSGVLNTFLNPMPTVPFQAAEFRADMPRGVFIEELYCVLSGNFTVSGGTTDGALNSEPIARLIDSLHIRWDGTDLYGPFSGRDAVAISKYLTAQPLSSDDITAPGVQNTDFKLAFKIPFNRAYLADPFDTVLPPLAVGSEFVLKTRWNQTANAGAGSSAGSGAIVTGGDRACVLSDVQLTVTPRTAIDGKSPYMLPILSSYDTEQFSAANGRLALRMNSALPFDSVLLRTYENALENPADLLNSVTLKTDTVRIYDAVPVNTLRMIEEGQFPAYNPTNDPGAHMLLFADGGKLGNAIDPAQLANPRFEFDVQAPAANPGYVRAFVFELLSLKGEGVTRF